MEHTDIFATKEKMADLRTLANAGWIHEDRVMVMLNLNLRR